jgi:anionic cell wall polymer biosynthesis LytR-Cps2A-Psr (LCP) family protein
VYNYSAVKKYIFTNQRWLAASLALVIVAVSAIASYVFFSKKLPASKTQATENILEPTSLDIDAQPPEELKTVSFLLLGYGGAGHQGGYLADVIQLVYINFDTTQVALISIPRDLWIKLPNGKQAKINQALTLGDDPNQLIQSGGKVAKQMTEIVTGLPVNYFIGIDFVGFQRLIGGNLSGIEVNVAETLDDPWYPIQGEELNTCGKSPEEVAELTAQYSGFELERQFECRYEHLYFEPGLTHMEGGDALKYVRSRHGSAAGDFSRSQRQHEVLEGIKKKALSLDVLDDLPSFFKAASQHVTTDLNLEVIKYLTPAIKAAKDFQVNKIILSTQNVLTSGQSTSGQSILLPQQGLGQWQQVHEFIQSELN